MCLGAVFLIHAPVSHREVEEVGQAIHLDHQFRPPDQLALKALVLVALGERGRSAGHHAPSWPAFAVGFRFQLFSKPRATATGSARLHGNNRSGRSDDIIS